MRRKKMVLYAVCSVNHRLDRFPTVRCTVKAKWGDRLAAVWAACDKGFRPFRGEFLVAKPASMWRVGVIEQAVKRGVR